MRAAMRGGSANYTYWFWNNDSNKRCSLYNTLYELNVLNVTTEQLKEIEEFQSVINRKLEVERFERNKILLKNTLDVSEVTTIYELDSKCAKETQEVYETFLKNNYDSQN
jgi:hypothetical protein